MRNKEKSIYLGKNLPGCEHCIFFRRCAGPRDACKENEK